MTHHKTVSIIIPAYRCRTTLLRAVESVFSQTYTDWQLIVIDDACPDQSYQVLNVITDKRLVILHNEENIGVAKTRNKGIEYATGQYIAFLDADDYWLPEKLAQQTDLLEQGYDIVFSAYFRELNTVRKLVSVPQQTDRKSMLKSNVIGNLTGIYHVAKLGKVYQQPIGHEDYLMWLELLQKTSRTCGIQEPLAVYTVQPNSASANKFKAAAWQWFIYRHRLNLGYTQSLYYFSCYIINALLKRY